MERITIDSDSAPHMVKIKGLTRKSVEQARHALEYTVRHVSLDRSQLDHFRDNNYARLTAIQVKSRVLSIQAVPPPAGAAGAAHTTLKVLGLVGDVDTAEALIDADLDFKREADAQERAMNQMQTRLDEVKASYGEGRRYAPQAQQQQQQQQQRAPQQQQQAQPRAGGGGGGGGGGGLRSPGAPAAGRPSNQAQQQAPQQQAQAQAQAAAAAAAAPQQQQQQRRAALPPAALAEAKAQAQGQAQAQRRR